MANQNDDINDASGVFRQESVISLYQPPPMTPTQTNGIGILGSTLSPEAAPISGTAQMVRNASYGNLGTQSEARVLVLYTGGTIGMLRNDKNGENGSQMNVCHPLFTF